MYLLPDPTYIRRADFDALPATFRKTEQYELERAIREAEEAARLRRKAERRNRRKRFFGPRTGHRPPHRGGLRLVPDRD